MMNEVRGELFLRRLPAEIRDGLSPAQAAAIRAAAGAGRETERHRLDLEFSLPTPWGRYYVAIFAGPERRGAGRRDAARRQTPRLRPLTRAGDRSNRIIRNTCVGLLLLAALLIYEAAALP